jgi:hypothetical protein
MNGLKRASPNLGEMRAIYDNRMPAPVIRITKLQRDAGAIASFVP